MTADTPSRRVVLTLQYDGSAYNGWQIQPVGITIQGLLQECIQKITGERTDVLASGRTDAGVHAIEQIAAFDSHSRLSTAVLKNALNALLPEDIRVKEIREAEGDFHPRYDAISRRYSYMIATMEYIPPFFRQYVWWVRIPLMLEAMKTASVHLIGKHDFSSFRGSGCGAKSAVRNIYCVEIERLPGAQFLFSTLQGEFIRVSIEADAFLRHMVRNIVGTLVEVGRGRMDSGMVKGILESKDRRLAGPAAPAHGLFLEKIRYPSDAFLTQ